MEESDLQKKTCVIKEYDSIKSEEVKRAELDKLWIVLVRPLLKQA